jgi:hypothetical protein
MLGYTCSWTLGQTYQGSLVFDEKLTLLPVYRPASSHTSAMYYILILQFWWKFSLSTLHVIHVFPFHDERDFYFPGMHPDCGRSSFHVSLWLLVCVRVSKHFDLRSQAGLLFLAPVGSIVMGTDHHYERLSMYLRSSYLCGYDSVAPSHFFVGVWLLAVFIPGCMTFGTSIRILLHLMNSPFRSG